MKNELERRQGATARVLDALRDAGKSGCLNSELNTVCFRFGARLKELRDQNYKIATELVSRGVFRYTLQAEPAA